MQIKGQKPYTFLKERGLLYQTTNEQEVERLLNEQPTTFYLGIDPTADSIHIGHLCSLRTFSYLQQAGHKGILVVGGATAMIGDPSGRQDMRKVLTKEKCEQNMQTIAEFAKKFIKTEGENAALILNNDEWMKNFSYIEFMRDIGTFFNVNVMLSAEAYKNRLANGGLTFLEMGYMPIQAYDFEHLFVNNGCMLQVGGSDQWGNMVAGGELIRKKHQKQVFALTTPLLLNSKGEKMGKSTGGALWVSEGKTSVYDFYQYFVNVADSDVKTLLNWFSEFETSEIEKMCNEDVVAAKRVMAFEITKLVHGEENAIVAEKTAKEVFAGSGISDNMPTYEIASAKMQEGINVCDLLLDAKIVTSKSEARRLIEQGAIVVDGQKVEEFSATVCKQEKFVIKKGKKVNVLVKLV